jgi:hypothetical protein
VASGPEMVKQVRYNLPSKQKQPTINQIETLHRSISINMSRITVLGGKVDPPAETVELFECLAGYCLN